MCRFFKIDFWIFFLLIIASSVINGQDIHFSQFYNAPIHLSPALSGVMKEDIRLVANYRQQWQEVPVPYQTFSGSFDQKLRWPYLENGMLAGGVIFNYDKSGDAELALAQLGVSVNYTQMISEQIFISGGVQVAGNQRSIADQNLTWAEQWNGDVFDPTIAPTENFSGGSEYYLTIGTGVNFHFQIPATRTKFDVGVSAFNLNRPVVEFSNMDMDAPEVALSPRTNFYLQGWYQLGPLADLRGVANLAWQNGYREQILGTHIRYHLNTDRNKETAITFGTNYRIDDAFIPTIEVEYFAWRVGFSYDLNISDFNAATRYQGGPELSLQYLITRVRPTKMLKQCSIF